MRQVTETDPRQAIAEYATRFHAALGSEHAAASPLSAWLLLALIAPAARGEARADLERVLGMRAEDASAFAGRLLASPHPAVKVALASWTRPGILTEWLDSLAPEVERGRIPSQEAADAWARAATRGLIERFPLAVHDEAVLLCASALVAEGEWNREFDPAPGELLGSSPWAIEVGQVLQDHVPGRGTILQTESAGLVAAQVKGSKGFNVASVIAAPDVPMPVVMAAAHEVAAASVEMSRTTTLVSLYDLPLGDGHAWTITERKYSSEEPNVRTESAHLVLPAWEVPVRTFDLTSNPAFGLSAAVRALLLNLPPPIEDYNATAKQATRARFDRYGFSAASVTALQMMETMAMPAPEEFMATHRTAEVRFGRPYAVVAFGDTKPGDPWHKVPFVTAWVTQPSEPSSRKRPDAARERLRKELLANAEKRKAR